ncbi:MAG: hypothetical protein JNL80_00865 [Phycisphaerae bacterium]|nr:hypothetical protein [Phycisphaerae bacterium]
MSLLPRPLILLIWLRLRASLRLLGRTARTPKGLAVLLVGGVFIAMGFVPLILSLFIERPPSPEAVAATRERSLLLLPFGILGLVLLSVVRTAGDGALAFLQAEVDFLFPAPFTRAQLLLYKLAQRVVPLLWLSLFVSVWVRRLGQAWLPTWVGLLLTLWFVHILSLCLALAGQKFEARRFALWRRVAAVVTLVVVVAGVLWAGRAVESGKPLEMVEAFARSTPGWLFTLPTLPFARTICAAGLTSDGLLPVTLALLINVALIVVAIRLNAHWLEAGAESSQRLAARADEIRRTGGFGGGASFSGLRMPMFPRFGGLGPLAWRQCVAGIRQGLRGLFVLAIMVAVMVVPPLLSNRTNSLPGALRPIGAILLCYISLFLPQVLRLDFRADVDRLDLLKGLPVSPFLVSLAQVIVPATLITGIQAPLGLVLNQTLGWQIPGLAYWIPAAFFANLLIASLENIAFLLWPQRTTRGAGVQFAMSQVVGQMLKLLALAILVGSAVAVGVGAFVLLGRSVPLAAVAVASVLALESAVTVLIVSRLFAAFDPAVEQAADA